MLDTAFLQRQKTALDNERAEIQSLNAMTEKDTNTVELDQSRIGRLSRMDAMQQQAMFEEQHRRRQIRLKKISIALGRMEKGDYGWCQDCDEEINPRRLEIDPAAEFCTRCADKHA